MLCLLLVEILQLVVGHAVPPYRPYISSNATVDEQLITLMQECWVEDPKERPDFNGIGMLFARFHKHKYA